VKFLLDASALIPLVTRAGKHLLTLAARESLFTTDLAIYEACSSLWKLSTLLKRISLVDGLEIADTIKQLSDTRTIQTVTFDELNLSRILKMADEEELTFYDASYIAAAESVEATLVTEDGTLRRRASSYVKTMTFETLKGKLGL